MHTVIVQYLAGELATKRTGRVTKVTAIQADIRTDISDSEVSQAWNELLQQTGGLADRHVLHFSDMSDTELGAASQAFEDSCVKKSTANLDNVPNGEFLIYRTVSCSRLCVHTKMTNASLC